VRSTILHLVQGPLDYSRIVAHLFMRCPLVIGTGTGALPVMDQVKREAQRRKVELVIVPTARAIELLKGQSLDTNAILHVTC
jgi:hypothetical protein